MSLLKYYMFSELQERQKQYEEYRNNGVNRRSMELAEQNMLKFFPSIPREEYERFIKKDPFFDEVLELVRYGFKKWYNWDPGEINVTHDFQYDINSYAYVDKAFPMFIHVDQLLETVVLWFMLTTLKWSKEHDDKSADHEYFVDLLYLLNEIALNGELPSEDGKESLISKTMNDVQIQNLASDCHWAMLVFTVAHEVAHIYQVETNEDYWKSHLKEAEYHADKVGYDILLRIIMEKQEKELIMEEYTYLAPMMYMDMFELLFETVRILYDKEISYGMHPSPDERIEAMFELADQAEYQFDTQDGNVVYYWFKWTYERYIVNLKRYKEAGNLDHIIEKYRY